MEHENKSENKINVSIFYDSRNEGDNDQAEVINRSLENKDVAIELVHIKTLTDTYDYSKVSFAIGVGVNPEIFGALRQCKNSGAKTSHFGHQAVAHETYESIDVVILPEHCAGEFSGDRSKLQIVSGVPTSITLEEVKNAYEKLDSDTQSWLLDEERPSVYISLPGDAQDVNGDMKLYTRQEARELGVSISQKYPNHKIIVVNGPRTGKHLQNEDGTLFIDEQGKPVVDTNAHVCEGKEHDSVTQAFIDAYTSEGKQENLKVCDFRYENKDAGIGVKSLYKPMLGAILRRKERNLRTVVVLPGESISQPCELIKLGIVPENNLEVYNLKCGSMNSQNTAFVEGIGLPIVNSLMEIVMECCIRREFQDANIGIVDILRKELEENKQPQPDCESKQR